MTEAITDTLYDSVWGQVNLSPLATQFVNTTEFFRLRNIAQLGSVSFYFTTATCSRFAHSIGVYHLAKKFATHLCKPVLSGSCKSEILRVRREIELISVAGLCHDIGHGPFSHVFDRVVSDSHSPMRVHEQRSIAIIRHMVSKYKIEISEQELIFIGKCINPSIEDSRDWRFSIVSSTFDVDRADYMLRDSLFSGRTILYNIQDIDTIIKNSKICGNSIEFSNDDQYRIYNLFSSRRALHDTVYSFHAVCGVEEMLFDIFKLCDTVFNFSSAINSVEKFVELDDSILSTILHTDDVCDEAKGLVTRLLERKFYKTRELHGDTLPKLHPKQIQVTKSISMGGYTKHPMLELNFHDNNRIRDMYSYSYTQHADTKRIIVDKVFS